MSFISKTIKKKQTATQSNNTSSSEEMSKCPKCGEPVYFAERKTILGKDWHSRCLRCDNCDKALTPGQHSAHLDKPYCNGCYQSMFGPEGFRQGTVEPRKIVIKGTPPARRDTFSKSDLKTRIKEYNMYKVNPVDKLKSRETNGQILFEGLLKLYWGLKQPIILSSGFMYSRRHSSIRGSMADFVNIDDETYKEMLAEAEEEKMKREGGQEWKKEGVQEKERSGKKVHEIVSTGWDSQERMPPPRLPGDEFSEVDLTKSMPSSGFNSLPHRKNHRQPSVGSGSSGDEEADGNVGSRSLTRGTSVDPAMFNSRSPIRKRSASFRKISKQKRIEGKAQSDIHHKFTPPHGSATSVRVTSTIPTKDVILMLIAKYQVENPVSEFALCVVHDSGVHEYLSNEDYPLQRRLRLGPSEDIAKIFITEVNLEEEKEQLTEEVAAWIKFSLTELQQFNKKFVEEMLREEDKIKQRFSSVKEALKKQLQNGRLETDV